MYELADEVTAANAVIHRHVQSDLRLLLAAGREGQISADAGLAQGECAALWSSPDLLWSQTCGQPLHSTYAQQLTPIGTPTYSAEGCSPGTYCSWIVVRSLDVHRFPSLAALAGAKLAVNSADSWSGAVSLRCAVEALISNPRGSSQMVYFHPEVLLTGSHRESLRALQEQPDRAHCAAIDCITWDLLRRTNPAAISGLTIIGQTEPMLAPPIVVQRRLAPELGAAVAGAFRAVCCGSPASATDPQELQVLSDALKTCGIVGFTTVGAEAYEKAFADGNKRAQCVQLQPWATTLEGNDDAGTAAQLQKLGYPASAHSYFRRLDFSGYHFPVTTTHAAAQRWFSRGMQLSHAFNHEQAIATFRMALMADPECIMAHWGLAYCSGVNYNSTLLEGETMQCCREHVAEMAALLERPECANKYSSVERELCAAIALRAVSADSYPGNGEEESRAVLQASNEKYAERMRGIYEACLADGGGSPLMAEVTVLAVEAIMQLRPWKLWPPHIYGDDEAAEVPEDAVHADTLYAQQALEGALQNFSPHPGLAHFYVHLMEMAPRKRLVRKAAPQADIIRRQFPACGHLLHMASHIDLQLGSYCAAIDANLAGIQQDDDVQQLTGVGRNTDYHSYRLHNHHMLCFSAMLAGQFALALRFAEESLETTPTALLDKYIAFLEPQMAMPWHALVRFGKWEALLQRPLPFDTDTSGKFIVCQTTALYAKALALTSLGRLEEAKAMQTRFEATRAMVPPTRILHNVTSNQSLEVASSMLQGELDYRAAVHAMPANRQEWDPADLKGVFGALDILAHAAQLERDLPYDEPWGWMQPVSHAIGALSIEQARRLEGLPALGAEAARLWALAEQAYDRDLKINLDNVWSLLGKYQILQHVGEQQSVFADPEKIVDRLRVARMAADEETAAAEHSCFCAGMLAQTDSSSSGCCSVDK